MSFWRFGSLPPELRLQIWEQILTVPTIWAATRNDDKHGEMRQPARLKTIGSNPFPAALACRESRRLLEQFFRMPIGVSSNTVIISGTGLTAHWMSLEWTVIYLGDTADATSMLDDLGAENVSRFKHVAMSNLEPVAISSSRFSKLAKVCQHLAASCPALQTVIIRREQRQPGVDDVLHEPLGQNMVDLYAALSVQHQSQTGDDEPFAPHLRALLLEYFGDRPPILH